MTAPQAATQPGVACQKCGSMNAAGARFCTGCGSAIGAAAPPPPNYPPPQPNYPPPPPPPPASPPSFGRFAGSGGNNVVMLEQDVHSAFQATMSALVEQGAQVNWQSPPGSARFSLVRRGNLLHTGGTKVRLNGDLSVAPQGPGRSTVALNLKADLGSATGVWVMVALAFIFGLFAFGMLGIILALAATALQVFLLSGAFPTDSAQKILDTIRMRAPTSAGSAYAPPPPPPPGNYGAQQWNQPQPPPPPPPRGPQPPPPPPPPESQQPPRSEQLAATGVFVPPTNGDSGQIIERLRKLAELRDVGAITSEDFERKKAELLSKL